MLSQFSTQGLSMLPLKASARRSIWIVEVAWYIFGVMK